MKKIVLALLVFCFAGVAFAQHRGGGYQHGGQRHGGYGLVAPLFIGAGAAYILTRPYYVAEPPPVVYYEPLPRVVPVSQQPNNCHQETRKIFDEKGGSLGEQVFLVCPLATAPPVVTR